MWVEGRASTLKLAVGAAVGAAVGWLLLVTGISAQQNCQPYPICFQQTQVATIQAGQGGVPTATPTNTVAAAATPTPTNTVAATAVPAAATAAPANSAVIMGNRGRVANVRATSFTVLWTGDAETTGQILYGTSSALGSTAADIRGGAVSSQTHYVDVTGLQPGTNYFFDVQTGGVVDNNLGQHYQIRTGPELGAPPSNNAVVGSVLNPGGGSPAGGALVWATVRDGNGQGTSGASQLLATIAGPDGRYRLGLQPRVPDLTSYFIYQNQGDFIDLFGRAATGEVSGTVGTEITADGGTAPAEARMVLMQVAATATVAPTTAAAVPTPTPVASPTPAPATPTVPAAAPTPVPPPTAPPAATAPPEAPPAATPGPAVQLPPLKEMLLARFGLAPADQVPPPVPTAPGAAGAYPPGAAAPGAVPAKPPAGAAAPIPPGGPANPVATPAGAPANPAPAGAINPAPGGPANPAAPPGAAAAPTPLGQAGVPGPTGALSPATSGGGAVAPRPGAPNPVASPLDQQAQPQPAATAPAVVGAPAPAPTVLAAPAPTGLASMPPVVSLLFYGGMLLVLAGCGVAVYSLLNGPDWRPR